jgi:hypothetical protein
MTGVAFRGRAFDRYDARSDTIDLSGLTGRIDLVVTRGRA